tara:strand:+ start:601 stop:1413 length:813 start_codon:yes stop_codon:yes gene_type:complete
MILNTPFLNKLFILALLPLIGFQHSYASKNQELKKRKFKPHMLFHPIEGCPTNSNCTKKAALLRQRWIELIHNQTLSVSKKTQKLNKFKKKFGILIPIWASPLGAKDKSVISWRSPCSHHTKKGEEKIYIAETFLKNIKKKFILQNNKFIPQKAFLLEKSRSNNKFSIKEYFIPRDDTPLFMKKDNLFFQLEYEGVYVGLNIKDDGRMILSNEKIPRNNFPENVVCPQLLVDKFKSETTAKSLHLGHFCQAIWDKASKNYKTMIFGHSCN